MLQFFGEFLVESGSIDDEQLRRALDLCDQVNLRIGELAVREGWMGADQVQAVLKKQQMVDRRFGEIAVDLGYLTATQVGILVHQCSASHLYVGESLVQIGCLGRAELEHQLEQYKRRTESFTRHCQTPSEVERVAIARHAVEAFPRIACRMGRLQVLSRWVPGWVANPRCIHRRWIEVGGSASLAIGFAACSDVARQITTSMQVCGVEDPGEEDYGYAVGEFLKLVVESAKAAAEGEGALALHSPPRATNYPTAGSCLLLLTNRGPGCLVIGPTSM